MTKRRKSTEIVPRPEPDYGGLLTGISDLLDQARRMTARTVNNILTATYWEIGRRIVEYEQGGKARAEYGEELLKRLGTDLSVKHGRGFSWRNLFRMRAFYLAWEICRQRRQNSRLGRDCPQIRGKTTRYCRQRRQYRRETQLRKHRLRNCRLCLLPLPLPAPLPLFSRSPGPITSA